MVGAEKVGSLIATRSTTPIHVVTMQSRPVMRGLLGDKEKFRSARITLENILIAGIAQKLNAQSSKCRWQRLVGLNPEETMI